MRKQTKEEWFNKKHEEAKLGFGDYCQYCEHYEEYAFPRENDFEEWCCKNNDYLKNINVDNGCENFDMGSIDDWDY